MRFCAGIAVDAPLQDIVRGIEEVDAVPGRCELIDDELIDEELIVDYAHTPDALSRLLDTVRECGPRRIITGIALD
jgi:UDP-N-acetylmuramyl tripeptide synthase